MKDQTGIPLNIDRRTLCRLFPAKTPMKRNEYTDTRFILLTGYAPTGMLGNASTLKSYSEAFYDARENPIYSPMAEMCSLPRWRNDGNGQRA